MQMSQYNSKEVAHIIEIAVARERERCAKVAESICQHRKGPRVKCEFGDAPELIAGRIRKGT